MTQHKLMRILTTNYKENNYERIYDADLFQSHQTNKTLRQTLDKLCNKNLIFMQIDGDDNIIHLEFTSKGVTYFEDVFKDNLRFWLPTIISLIALFRPEIMSLIKSIFKTF